MQKVMFPRIANWFRWPIEMTKCQSRSLKGLVSPNRNIWQQEFEREVYLEKLWCATMMTKSAQKFRSLVFKNLYWNQCDYLQSSPHSTVNTWPIGAPITCSNFGPFIGVAFVSSSDPLWKVSDLFDLKKA